MDDYLRQTVFSDPGDLDVSGLPVTAGQLAETVRELIIHRLEGGRFGYAIPEQRLHEDAESRYVTEILRLLRERRDAPLTEERAPHERFVGTCRDFSLLLCSLLRATGTPARIRGGFATYFVADFLEDHWVTEYRLPDGSWRLVDPQVLHPSYEVPFDPLDVPRDRFLVAADVWRGCREGRIDPARCGFHSVDRLRGLWLVRARLLQDLAALGGVEPLPWDGWGPRQVRDDADLTEEDLALLDAAARNGEPVSVPDTITSYTTYGGVRRITLRRSSPPA
ncbi:transglutaminase-like domain-containing protein [Streptomyces sp. S.PB5]|uniref:transglutaminase-like domain-containing protein n=1 Tax=Streptomyces sp. S.PB5 TaxID=3020844 RepID=UPI0025AF817A|nr:transglutaminase-like domain-containing protein [Streptomyces sp. S.PB5]MDN3021692.1 transglutaminase-like domain-containing protein [Streptomyces sp. S.PB5]